MQISHTFPTRLLPTLLVGAVALVSASPALAQTGGSTSGDGAAGTVAATLEQCLTTGGQAARSATFSGEMTAVAGVARMAIRIEVQERIDGREEPFHTVATPALGSWRASNPGVHIYKYVRQLTDLFAPADYRALVRYHWLNDKGAVIRRAERHTLACVQPASPAPSPATPLE